MSREPFYSWTIFNRPADFPMGAVCRKFEWDQPTAECIRGWTVEEVRAKLLARFPDLVCIPRSESDPASIVETWL